MKYEMRLEIQAVAKPCSLLYSLAQNNDVLGRNIIYLGFLRYRKTNFNLAGPHKHPKLSGVV